MEYRAVHIGIGISRCRPRIRPLQRFLQNIAILMHKTTDSQNIKNVHANVRVNGDHY